MASRSSKIDWDQHPNKDGNDRCVMPRLDMLSLPVQPVELLKNRILANLSHTELDHLMPKMQTVWLKDHQPIYTPGDKVRSVYFPATAVLALVNTLEDGSSLAAGVVGHEGMACLPVFLGVDSSPHDLLVQVPGIAHRMLATVLSEEADYSSHLHDLLLRYTQAFLDLVTQTAACSRHHLVKQRLATWLLMLHDRTTPNRLPMTHEVLGRMLGVGRPSVTLAMDALHRAGFICHSRGAITIIDQYGLEATACECYQLIRDEYDRLLG